LVQIIDRLVHQAADEHGLCARRREGIFSERHVWRSSASLGPEGRMRVPQFAATEPTSTRKPAG
jgi:hypothetical protein